MAEAPKPDHVAAVDSPTVPDKVEDVEASADTLDLERFRRIESHKELRSMLGNSRLQKLILKIDSAPDRKAELDKARRNPHFRDFIDQLLLVTGYATKQPDGSVQFVG